MDNIHIIGINHKSTNLEIREKVMFVPNLISKAYQSIQEYNVDEVFLISTCARTECIVITQDINAIKNWFAEFHNLTQAESLENIIQLQGKDAISHLMRLAAGIDSFILGENQVLGQLKKAFSIAEEHGAIGPVFYKLFSSVFAVAKQIRTKTNINSKNTSLAGSLANVSMNILGDLKNSNVMLIGAGEMIQLTATHLCTKGVSSWIMANRTLEKAQKLANSFAGKDIVIEEIPKYLIEADIVVSATASPIPLIGKGLIERIQKLRTYKPIILADLAMPRDIEPEVSQIPGVYLFHLDDLQKMIQVNLDVRLNAVSQATPMINHACERFLQEQNSLSQIQVLRNFRDHVENIAQNEKQQALKKLKRGADPENIINLAMNNLTKKILHTPTINIRNAARSHNHNMIQCAGYIFDLEEPKETSHE